MPTHQMTETNHRSPLGGEAMVVAMVCSALELARLTNQHTSTTTAAGPSRKASLPRRRVCPLPQPGRRSVVDRHGRSAGPLWGAALRIVSSSPTDRAGLSGPDEPSRKGASPKAKSPPSEATNQ